MSQFLNEAFQFDFVKGLVQTQRPTVAMATSLPFHFYIYFLDKLLHILENFINCQNFLFSGCPYLNNNH